MAKILQHAANAVLSGLQKNRKKAFARPSFHTVYPPGVPLIGQTQNMESPELDGRMQLTREANTEQPKLAPERKLAALWWEDVTMGSTMMAAPSWWKLSSLPLLSCFPVCDRLQSASETPEEPNEPESVSNHKLWDTNPESRPGATIFPHANSSNANKLLVPDWKP